MRDDSHGVDTQIRAGVKGALTGIRTALTAVGSSATIYLCVPFGQFTVSPITLGFSDYRTATGDTNNKLIDLGSAGSAIVAAHHSGDGTGIHPDSVGSAMEANLMIPIVSTTAITLSGPTGGTFGSPSSAFTCALANTATFTGSQDITLTASSGTITATAAGGSISGNGTGAVTVTAASGQTNFTFTFTPAGVGTATITPSTTQANWTMPSANSYVCTATPTHSAARRLASATGPFAP